MRIKHGFIKERTNFIKKLFITAKAEEGVDPTPTPEGDPTPTPVNTPQINYEELIAKARQQEKDKLYPQIKKLEDEKKALIEKNNTNLLIIGEKDQKITTLTNELNTLKSNTNVSAREQELLSENERLKAELDTLKSETVSVDEIEKSIREEYEVKLYRSEKLREVGEEVIPELITGTTKEEIDASIKLSQERFKTLQEKILGQAQTVPVANTSVSTIQSNSNLKIEDIAKLDPKSPEYKEMRIKLGLAKY